MNTPDTLIDRYEDEAVACDEGGYPAMAAEAQLTANILTKFRDALMQIAQCQGAVPSHQAQDVLREVGYCDHARTIYSAQFSGKANAYTCSDCGRASPERLVAYQ